MAFASWSQYSVSSLECWLGNRKVTWLVPILVWAFLLELHLRLLFHVILFGDKRNWLLACISADKNYVRSVTEWSGFSL